MNRSSMKLKAFHDFVTELAALSTCKRAQVGCIIYPEDFSQVYSIGYNGPSRGEHNNSCTGEMGSCGCVHAEANALLKLQTIDTKCILLSTVFPCIHCAGLIVNSQRINRVYYINTYRNDRGVKRLNDAGIQVIPIQVILHDQV